MDMKELAAHKRIDTPHGRIAYAEIGEGPAALFVHGVFMNGALWRHALAELSDIRRCIAIDLPGHGDTRVDPGLEPSLEAQTEVVRSFCDALELDRFDLVGNDTGGAISQILAVGDPARLRTLTLTNCDAHDNIPPAAFKAGIELASAGELAPLVAKAAEDLELARSEAGLGIGFERPEYVTPEIARGYLGPFTDLERGRQVERRIAAMRGDELLRIEDGLMKLDVPTLLVWGTGDVFFELSWAYWLRDAIPGAEEVVEIPGGKLFFPDERASELIPHLRRHWTAHEPTTGRGTEER